MSALRASVVLLAFVCLVPSLQAQNRRPVPYPVLPPPQFEQALAAGTRTATGEPGPTYWTNTADYSIQATLTPETNTLTGTQTIRYHNNSPVELPFVMIHLRQNLHRPDAMRNRQVPLTGGIEVTDIRYNGAPLQERTSTDMPGYAIGDTRMLIALPEPIQPGASGAFSMRWAFEVPTLGAPRMGQDGEVYYLGYWYPQMAVFDDLEGWTADVYMGAGEFYMGYGDYDVEITVPEGWLVAATGTLQNAADVLPNQIQQRLARAAQTREVVSIVGASERSPGTSTLDSNTGTLTWHFQAEQVRDFAFVTSASYVWDATSATVGDLDGDGQTEKSMIHSLYRPGTASWNRSAEFAQFSIEHLSETIMPYPYPHMTAVEGIIGGGMEYPMITLIGGNRNDSSLFGVTYHEIGHMWFPMIVGQNEKRFTWMDEGLTSYNTNEGRSAFFDTNAWDPSAQSYYLIAGTGNEVEPMRHGDQYPLGSPARGIAGYSKPAVTLHTLRGILGQERFERAYREYARRWAFKHPQPYDLFNTFEDVLNEDLDWFWTPFFFETWTLDQAIGGVEQDGERTVVTVADYGLTPLPALVRVTYENGQTEEKVVPVEVWLSGEREATLTFAPGTVTRVEIDPGQYLPDIDRENNTWGN